MANECKVQLKKTISPLSFGELLNDLNFSMFKGNLAVDYNKRSKERPGWGRHTWHLVYENHGREWASRVCWVNSALTWHIRHGGGSDFAWWLDCAITNEVAVKFDGIIRDSGYDAKQPGQPGRFSIVNFLRGMHPKQVGNLDPTEDRLAWFIEDWPPEFQDEVFAAYTGLTPV